MGYFKDSLFPFGSLDPPAHLGVVRTSTALHTEVSHDRPVVPRTCAPRKYTQSVPRGRPPPTRHCGEPRPLFHRVEVPDYNITHLVSDTDSRETPCVFYVPVCVAGTVVGKIVERGDTEQDLGGVVESEVSGGFVFRGTQDDDEGGVS